MEERGGVELGCKQNYLLHSLHTQHTASLAALDLHLNSSETLHISHSFASGFGLGPASAGTRALIKHLLSRRLQGHWPEVLETLCRKIPCRGSAKAALADGALPSYGL